MKLSYKNHLLFIVLCILPTLTIAQTVRIETNLGNIDVELNSEAAPNTVANFLTYMNRGDYDDSIIHRSANNSDTLANFVIQGGGFHQREEELIPIPADDPIANEFSLLNQRGTIAMAKAGGFPDSATSQWFINTTDNPGLDDPLNSGGFTVFGEVVNGMEIVDLIGSIRIWTNAGGSDLNSIPLLSYPGEGLVYDYAIKVSNIDFFEQSFQINSGHSGAWFNQNTPGQGILFEVLPESNLVFMAWFTFDTVAPPEDVTSIVGAPGHRWITGLGEINQETNSITFDLALTAGGLFDNPTPVMNSEPNSYGTLTATINNCTDMDVSYNLTQQELQGDFSMVRISDDNVALCEALSLQ
ncbi:MAG: peptidylprolyl isomerase [Marinicellaceae bacterium]